MLWLGYCNTVGSVRIRPASCEKDGPLMLKVDSKNKNIETANPFWSPVLSCLYDLDPWSLELLSGDTVHDFRVNLNHCSFVQWFKNVIYFLIPPTVSIVNFKCQLSRVHKVDIAFGLKSGSQSSTHFPDHQIPRFLWHLIKKKFGYHRVYIIAWYNGRLPRPGIPWSTYHVNVHHYHPSDHDHPSGIGHHRQGLCSLPAGHLQNRTNCKWYDM